MPFSHKRHAALRLPCATCHPTAKKAERAGFPAASNCMVCHQAVLRSSPAIERLASLSADAKPFPSNPANRLADFVFFSHERHGTAAIDCTTCHGVVVERDSLPEAPRTMKACVDCHKKKNATIDCTACHELNQ